MSAPQSDAFKQAVVDSKKLLAKPSNDELLELYGEPWPPLASHAQLVPQHSETQQRAQPQISSCLLLGNHS